MYRNAAKHSKKLQETGITHIVNSSYTASRSTFSPLGVGTSEDYYSSKGFNCKFLGLPAIDVAGFKISQYFETSTNFIHSALENNGKSYFVLKL